MHFLSVYGFLLISRIEGTEVPKEGNQNRDLWKAVCLQIASNVRTLRPVRGDHYVG